MQFVRLNKLNARARPTNCYASRNVLCGRRSSVRSLGRKHPFSTWGTSIHFTGTGLPF